MQELADGLRDLPGATVRLLDRGEVPQVALDLAPGGCGALELMRRLESGTPPVHADPFAVAEGRILFAPPCLKDGRARPDRPAGAGGAGRAAPGESG